MERNGDDKVNRGWGKRTRAGGGEPSVLIFGNHEPSRAAAIAAAQSVGARVVGAEPIDRALERLSRQAGIDSVVIELDGSAGVHVDRLLDWANQAGRQGTTRPVISLPTSLIDYVLARVDDSTVSLLCDARVEDRAAQLGLLFAERRQQLHDQGVEADAERLRRLSEEVARIAGALAELSSSAKSAAYAAPKELPVAPTDAPIDANMVRSLLRVRRLRDQFFSKDLFADPAWDMLLDLMAARSKAGWRSPASASRLRSRPPQPSAGSEP